MYFYQDSPGDIHFIPNFEGGTFFCQVYIINVTLTPVQFYVILNNG